MEICTGTAFMKPIEAALVARMLAALRRAARLCDGWVGTAYKEI